MKHKDTIQAYWESFLNSAPQDVKDSHPNYEAWPFGDSPEMADELGGLVCQGVKTATASLVWVYEAEQEPLPKVGDYSIILDGREQPMCIIRTTKLDIVPFDEVDAEQAYLEGEGDRSLDFWREVHWRFFSRECAQIGKQPDQKMPILCERFELVYP